MLLSLFLVLLYYFLFVLGLVSAVHYVGTVCIVCIGSNVVSHHHHCVQCIGQTDRQKFAQYFKKVK